MSDGDKNAAADGAERAAAAARELVEHVDEGGHVVDVVTRAEMRSGNLRHRCTYVAVLAGTAPQNFDQDRPPRFDPKTEVWIHKRAAWKDTNPSYWDLAFGGVCDVGEGWAASAERELAEEAGISNSPLLDLGVGRYEDRLTRVVGRAFVTWWSDEPSCQDGEVVAVDRIPIGELQAWVDTTRVCPDSAAIMVPLLTD